MEQGKGHGGANIVTVIMRSKNVDLQTAVDFLAGYCEALVARFLEAKHILMSRSDPAYSGNVICALETFGDRVRNDILAKKPTR
jgi:hypothetical protein